MKHDALAIERTLAAAIGDEPGLAAELQAVFFESAARHALAMTQAEDATAWRDAALRLKGCAASFGATDLQAAAHHAAEAGAGDPLVLSAVAAALGALGE
jgi:HPt (histidine-containing phosphotransfer) domain-containing protein